MEMFGGRHAEGTEDGSDESALDEPEYSFVLLSLLLLLFLLLLLLLLLLLS